MSWQSYLMKLWFLEESSKNVYIHMIFTDTNVLAMDSPVSHIAFLNNQLKMVVERGNMIDWGTYGHKVPENSGFSSE